MAEESLRTMTYKELLDHLSKLSPEQLERKAILYDTLSGHLYTPKEIIQTGEGDETLNLPLLDDDIAIITF